MKKLGFSGGGQSIVERNCPMSSEVTRQQKNRGKEGVGSMLFSPAMKTQEAMGSSHHVVRNGVNDSLALPTSPRPRL